jgi:hypothetical protein
MMSLRVKVNVLLRPSPATPCATRDVFQGVIFTSKLGLNPFSNEEFAKEPKWNQWVIGNDRSDKPLKRIRLKRQGPGEGTEQ